ncbi:hypothetical protein [Agrococcus sp. SGAir0287]|uniref:hypothetical protein n=1 Tax=Agrococcus sp. SGAir0287 TaxID=2070347 RepID=UPI001585D658|nr:hypothetical protein [Agrococcus sp. SGAir0287]
MLARLATTAQGYDPDSVTPGVIGFVATAVVAVIVCFLLFDMNRRVRRVRYREEVRAQIAAEQADADAEAPRDGEGGVAASSPVEPSTPEPGGRQG